MHSSDPMMDVATVLSQLELIPVMLHKANFDPLVYEDFMESFTNLIKKIVQPDSQGNTLTAESLLQTFQDPECKQLSHSLILLSADCPMMLSIKFHCRTFTPLHISANSGRP